MNKYDFVAGTLYDGSLCISGREGMLVLDRIKDLIGAGTAAAMWQLGALVGSCYCRYRKDALSEEEQTSWARAHARDLDVGEWVSTNTHLVSAFLAGWAVGYLATQAHLLSFAREPTDLLARRA